MYNFEHKPRQLKSENRERDCLNRLPRGTNPKKDKTIEFWKQHPLSHLLNFSGLTDNNKVCCMACGTTDYGMESAHIFAKFYKGSNYENNIHILCGPCHHRTEMLEGWAYWLWIALMSKIYHKGSDMTIELDWTSRKDKTLKEYPIQFEYKQKLMDNYIIYETLSVMERWQIPQVYAEAILKGKGGPQWENVDFGDVSTISLIDEYILTKKPISYAELTKLDMVEQVIEISKMTDDDFTEKDAQEFREKMERQRKMNIQEILEEMKT